ncbi:MAG: hypothetical protein KatS3mg061_1569 [Dehalococcoidia bacterium]|nr:MAG: hypothetical protein KatS3mg061_1569 [Dehalococcoidia bacterium]
MHIIVCVKQVPDPETPASQFKVDEAAKKVVPPPGIAPTLNQYDANAVEAAIPTERAAWRPDYRALARAGECAGRHQASPLDGQ